MRIPGTEPAAFANQIGSGVIPTAAIPGGLRHALQAGARSPRFAVVMAGAVFPLHASGGLRREQVRQERLQKKVSRLPGYAHVRVRLKNDERLEGRVAALRQDGFILQSVPDRNLSYAEIKSIKHVKENGGGPFSSNRHLWMYVAIVGGILTIAFVAAASLD